MKSTSRYFILIAFMLSGFFVSTAQETPSDFLSSEFHKGRREALRAELPANSVAVFFANPVRNRANDVDYIYHQDPNLYYLTGYREPHAVLLIFKEDQQGEDGNYNEIFFIQERNAMQEMWAGRRLGTEGVKDKLAIMNTFNGSAFKDYNIDFEKFDKVLFYDFENDVRDDRRNTADLFSLIEQFKTKVGYGMNTSTLGAEPKKNNIDLESLDEMMSKLRGIKTEEELDLIRKAVFISTVGQVEVMKAMKPGMSETEIQGIHEYVFKKYGSEYEGYPSIVGAGNNGCILHYIENHKPNIESKEMILMDLGAEYHGYTADVTRTIPVDGEFSPEEKAIYDLVYKAQEEAIQRCKPGTSFREISTLAKDIINEGLVELGIIANVNERHLYYPHGLSHHIGLDVHDKGMYGDMEENMVITVEPGIYIPEGAKCDKKWWGIAVRIEDDILITKDGFELLSSFAPRTTEEIEKMMKKKSPLDSFELPKLKGSK
ncbi:M24 family metallopeptidase [Roseivirga pacifica]|uniref:aminopeptidase P N-terminal domain-containing protein n=2 Tax=Roseivirga pacifica TaxID=1267423 RepID=UPI0020958DA0|nr:aminopeptidase P N-terminal domain-containing protein [Roseivirga pacifica]MCO6359935.1 M24 family metallopeptidase [Roseivirga pacifica]MCO6367305.1 M24 family metallopeptidase [Roseivirga pacifica]MCO6370163.1 M24 family metallopeptidase [Roseivirga pacifica]MCO6374962.1 M24 family metallopeptidase [Roseivirga pacifica]MCO6380220.1 M24 family metallopeptidase [Roseivirga pacifica]